jgi:hypothetical protein
MKPENKYRTWFIDKFKGWLNQAHPGTTFVSRKHADYATGGILDMSLTINGVTVWTEFKQVPQCEKERKLEVSDLQRAELDEYTRAGAAAVVLVGLPLGPRRGYESAIFQQAIPTKVYRGDFRRMEVVFDVLYSMAETAAKRSVEKFK